MTERDTLADLLRRHDGPVDPTPAFADRLEARLLAELRPAASVAASRTSGVMPVPAESRPRRLDGPVVTRRTRWFDVAAAAVLLVSLMGGVLTQIGGRGGPTDIPTTVAAPRLLTSTGEEPPVTSFGSAARDNRWSGPGLPDGALTERWTVPVGGEGTNGEPTTVVQAVPYGGMVFSTRHAFNVSPDATGYVLSIEVRSLTDGKLIWSRQPDVRGLITVADAGVITIVSTGEPGTSATAPSALVLLDGATGAERWSYPLPDGPVQGDWSPTVVDGTVYYADSSATVYALDLADGTERWVSAVASVPVTGVGDGCNVAVIACLSGVFAVGPDTLYVTNSKAELAALDLMDGAERWTVDVAARYGIQDRAYVVPTAVELGVVVAISRFVPSSEDGTEDRQLALLDGHDGAEVWRTEPVGNAALSVVADEERVYLLSRSGTTSLSTVDAYALATGTALWRTPEEYAYPLDMLGDGHLYVGTGHDDAGHTSGIAALDPVNGTQVDAWQVAVGTPSLATAADGTLLVSGDTSLTAFSPSSSAVAAERAVMEGGSPARDNRYGGPALGEGELVERWVAPSSFPRSTAYRRQVLPAGNVVYQVIARVNGEGDEVFAYSLDTGALLWSRPNPVGATVAASGAGLLMLLPIDDRPATASPASTRTRLALLDPETGAERWSHPLVATSRDNVWSPIVDGDTVYVADVDARVYALDLATGTERWVSTETRGSLPETDPCMQTPVACGTNGFAVADGQVYVVTSATTLMAVDQADGSLRWEVDLAGSYGVPQRSTVHLTAVPGGVLLDLTGRVGKPTGLVEEGRLVRLDAVGAQLWTRDVRGQIAFGPTFTVDDERVFFGQVDAYGTCCSILAIDLATGETAWQSTATRIYPLGMVGGDLYGLGSLTVGANGADTTVYALDPETGQERWQERIPGGTPSLPLAADGTLFVDAAARDTWSGGLVAYLPANAGGDQPAAEVASAAEPIVMDGGSPARDNRWPGPSPAEDGLVERWAERLETGEWIWSARALGDTAYVLRGGGRDGGTLLEARSLADGAVLWERDATAYGMAVTSEGVVLVEPFVSATPATATTTALSPHADHVVLLDRATGAEVWRYAQEGVSGWIPSTPIVAEGIVYVVDADGDATALDLATGAERWTSTAAHAVPGVEMVDCEAPVPVCLYGGTALAGGVLFYANAVGAVHALDAATGEALWSVDLVARYGLERSQVSLLATADGVVVSMVALGTVRSDGTYAPPSDFRTALLAGADGAEVWTRDDVASYSPTSDGERLFVQMTAVDEDCCRVRIVALDLATGATAWEIAGTYGDLPGLAGGDEPDLLWLDQRDGVVGFLVGLDPATGEERWRQRIENGRPMLPTASDGTLLLWSYGNRLIAYQPAHDPAESIVATPVASPVGTPEPTPAGRGPGVPSTAGSFSPDHVVSAGQDVNLRSEPTTAAGGATVLDAIPDGTLLRATGRTAPADDPDNGPWVEVQLEDGTVGWLRAADVSWIDA